MTLPYTTPITAIPGQPLPAADFNTGIRDSLEALAYPPRCMAYRTTPQAVGHASVSNIVWQAEAYDTDDMWTPGGTADRIIVPRAGIYVATLTAQFGINAAGARYLAIAKNGAGVAQWHGVGTGTWYMGGTVVCIQPMVAGDYFTGIAYQTSGVALNLDTVYPINMVVAQIGR